MSRNELADTGKAEDLLRSIVQMGCAEVHAMTLYFKVESQLEHGLVDVTDPEILHKAIEKADMFREDINTYDDPELMRLAYESYKAFAKAVTRFLGVEISECASCLSDSLRATTKGVEDGTDN